MAKAEPKPTNWVKSALLGVAMFGLSVFMYYDLSRFEESEHKDKTLWAPLAFLYNIAGKGGVVMFFIVLGVAMLVIAYMERKKQLAR